MKVFIESTRTPGLRFELLEFNPDTKKAILIGPMGAKFERTITKPELEKYGYKLVREGEQHAEQSGVQAELHAGVQDGQEPGGSEGQHAAQEGAEDDAEEGAGEAGAGRGPQESVVDGWG